MAIEEILQNLDIIFGFAIQCTGILVVIFADKIPIVNFESNGVGDSKRNRTYYVILILIILIDILTIFLTPWYFLFGLMIISKFMIYERYRNAVHPRHPPRGGP